MAATSYVLLFTVLMSNLVNCRPQLVLDVAEQEAVYVVLEAINIATPWRSLFPDDLCSSAPHGVVCDSFFEPNATAPALHITELNFGYVSEYNPNPPCSLNSTLSPLIFTSFPHLRKLSFYKCFSVAQVSLPDDGFASSSFRSSLEELVFIDNPSMVGKLSTVIANFRKLRRLVLTGNGFDGTVPNRISDLVNLDEITLSRNRLGGELPLKWTPLKRTLKLLDLSHNYFTGGLPASIGSLCHLLKLDLSFNNFNGRIPDDFGGLQSLELLDLSFNRFGNFGIPLFLREMSSLREVYLSGNKLEGPIPDIWRDMRGVTAIGFSSMGLVGNIPASMGLYLRNLSYLLLDNNMLQGKVPVEFSLLDKAGEINLENNKLSGKLRLSDTFRSRMGKKPKLKLKLGGNPDLCIDDGNSNNRWKPCSEAENPSPATHGGSSFSSSSGCLIYVSLMIMVLLLAGGF